MRQRAVERKGHSLLSTRGNNATEQSALSDMLNLYKGRLSEVRLNDFDKGFTEAVPSGT
jgi:hypothetical protein